MKWVFCFLLFISACSHLWVNNLPQDAYLRLCFLGDTGRGNSTQRVVAKALKLEKCHGVFFVGDIIYKEGIKSPEDPKAQRLFFDYYEDLTQENHHPRLYLVMGNHDHQGNTQAWMQLSQDKNSVYFPNLFWKEKIKDVCLVAVDSNFSEPGILSSWKKEQDEFMSGLDNKNCRIKIAMAHHPFRTSGKRKHLKITQSLKEFYEKFIIGKYDFFIAGHEHFLNFEGAENNTWLFITGAGGRPDTGKNPGYLVLDIMDEEQTTIRSRLVEISWGKLHEKVFLRKLN